jgi:hypothetical protein
VLAAVFSPMPQRNLGSFARNRGYPVLKKWLGYRQADRRGGRRGFYLFGVRGAFLDVVEVNSSAKSLNGRSTIVPYLASREPPRSAPID